MTDRSRPQPDDEDDALAGEYVLGVLPLDERMAVETRLRSDPAFARRVEDWEDRLAGLNEGFADTPAPDLLPRIEARLFPKPARQVPRWGWVGGAVAAGLVALAVYVGLAPEPAGPVLVATLSAPEEALVFEARFDASTGSLSLERTAGADPAVGRDYQLWAIGAAGVPAPLGIVADESLVVDAVLAAGETLAVSLEPDGGSTTGAPTGPVLVTGVLTDG